MKTKLTLTVESGLIPQAKRYAGEKGVSLPQVVEGAGARWRGRFRAANRVSARYRRLAERIEL